PSEGAAVTTVPLLPNNGAMSQFVGAFEVVSKLTGKVYHCRFSHMWNGIATRHADTIDTKFFLEGDALVVGLSHTAFVKFRSRSGRHHTDRNPSWGAAKSVRERLKEEDERKLYEVAEDDVPRLIAQVGIN